jgi:hypothetical protein
VKAKLLFWRNSNTADTPPEVEPKPQLGVVTITKAEPEKVAVQVADARVVAQMGPLSLL